MDMYKHTKHGLCIIFIVLTTLDVLHIYCNICLTWDIANNHINLKCKTDNLRFKILFLDYLEREYAFCFVSFPKSICQVHYMQGEVTQDLLTNETHLTIPYTKEKKDNVWICRHGNNYEEATVEVNRGYKQDIITPEIRTNHTWPFEDGSVVELTCYAIIYGQTASLRWNCMGIEACEQHIVNCTQYTSILVYRADLQDNGRVCKCNVKTHSDSSSTSIKFDIRSKFSLDVQHQFECNSSEEVNLLCKISGNASSFGFDSWTHTFKGVFIRHLQGTDIGDQSVINIKPCQFFDCGEYLCRAWIKDQNGLKWLQKAGELTVRGPPNIVATHTISIPDVICTARFISVPSIYFIKWYLSDEVLNISSKYNQTCTEDTITVYMYGVPIAVTGYKATLTIQIDTEIGKDKNISLVLINELGKSSFSFSLWIDRKLFSIRIIQWILVGVAVVIIATIPTLAWNNRKKKKRQQHPSNFNIYYAAPTVENEPNIYNEMLSVNEDTVSQLNHQYDDVAISLDEAKTNSSNSSNDSQHYIHVD